MPRKEIRLEVNLDIDIEELRRCGHVGTDAEIATSFIKHLLVIATPLTLRVQSVLFVKGGR